MVSDLLQFPPEAGRNSERKLRVFSHQAIFRVCLQTQQVDKRQINCNTMHCNAVHGGNMKHLSELLRINTRLVRSRWGKLNRETLQQLRSVTMKFGLSIARNELQFLKGSWYITHSGLIAIAERNKCSGIRTAIIKELCDPSARRWVFRAIVYKFPKSRGFVGFGDADPPTHPLLSAARRCAWPKREPLIALCAKLTGSASVRLKSWDHFQPSQSLRFPAFKWTSQFERIE